MNLPNPVHSLFPLPVVIFGLWFLEPETASSQWDTLHGARAVIGQADFDSTGNSLTQGGLNMPFDLAIDPTTGKIFVSDADNNRILRFASAAAMTCGAPAEAVLGQPDFGSSASATTAAGLGYPTGLTVDSAGRLWVCDESNHRVLRYDNASARDNGAGADAVLGQANFMGGDPNRGGSIQANTMKNPFDVTVEPDGTLWVVDSGNNRILRFDNAAGKLDGAAADGVLGQSLFTTDASGRSDTALDFPVSAAVEADGTLWVTDQRRVLRFASAKGKDPGDGADGVLGQPNFTSNTGGVNQNTFTDPEGIGVDAAGTLWVTEGDKNRVLRFDNAKGKGNGANAEGVLGQSDFTTEITSSGQFRLKQPTSVAVAPTGEVFVSEGGNNRITVFEPNNGTPDPCPGAVPTDWTDGREAASVLGQLDFESGNPDRGAPAVTAGGMDSPGGVALDAATGKLFVADSQNNRVLRFTSVAKLLMGADPEAVFGQPDFVSKTGAAGTTGMRVPLGLCCDADGRLWVADQLNHRILRFDGAAAKASGAAADAVLGQPDFAASSSGTTRDKFDQPADVSVDGDGRLWVADLVNNRILKFNNAATLLNGSLADGVLGQADFVSGGNSNAAGGMSNPRGVFADSLGCLWVSDSSNHRVLRFDGAAAKADTDGADADGLLGISTFGGGGGGVRPDRMFAPGDVYMETTGRLWVADRGNNRVLWFEDAKNAANGADADGVLGQRDLFEKVIAVSRTGMSAPAQLAGDGSGRLFVADLDNHRVLRFNPGGYQVDGWIGTKRTGQKGNNQYNLGAGQKVTGKSKNRKKLKFHARIENDGPSDDTFSIKGTRKNGNFSIKYFDLIGGKTNVTAQVTKGTYMLTDVIADTDREIQIEVKPSRKTKDKKKTRTLKIKGTSAQNGTVDQVKAKAQTLK